MSEQIENRLLKLISPRRKPQTLFHYTSGSGLIGILESRSIWATSIRFLNDSTEYSLAFNLARKVVQELADKALGRFERALHTVLLERLTVDVQEVYVTSFTENADQLSQWRAYCPTTGGYSVGFRTKFLVDSLDSNPHRFLASCIYDSDAHQQLVRDLVKWVVLAAEESLSSGVTRDRVFRESYKQLGRLLPLLAPALKDPSFAEEQEWRLVCLPISFDNQKPHFRQGRSMLIPYHEHSFPNKIRVPIEELVIGPTPHSQLARDATYALLAANGITSTTVRSSSIPYRAW